MARSTKTLSTACIYTRTAKLQFPYSKLSEEVRATKARNLVTLAESKDDCIRGANIKLDEGRKTNTPTCLPKPKFPPSADCNPPSWDYNPPS